MSNEDRSASSALMGDDLPSTIRLADIHAGPLEADFCVHLRCNNCGDEESYWHDRYEAPTASSEESDDCDTCGTNDFEIVRTEYEGQEVVED